LSLLRVCSEFESARDREARRELEYEIVERDSRLTGTTALTYLELDYYSVTPTASTSHTSSTSSDAAGNAQTMCESNVE
jgi:hypothetical protein